MLSLQELSFARYEDNYFLNSGDGFLVIPKTFLSEYEHVKTFKDSPPEDKTKTAVDNKLVGKALKFFQENVDPSSVFSMKNKTKEDSTVDNKFFEKILDSIREKTSPSSVGSGGNKTFDDFLREKKAEEASDIVLIKKALDSIREKTSPSSVFSLENTSSNKVFFINMQTVVTLENATISDNLLITFLTRTKLRVGKSVSVVDSSKQDDLPKRTEGEYFGVKKEIGEKMLLKNIQQIKNTIECMTKTIAFGGCIVNLLSKIKIGENNELNLFTLKAHTKNQIEFSFFEDKQSISIGKPKKIMLFGYAVDLLPKLKIGEENETEVLLLDATEREQVEYTLGFTHDKKEKICVGKVSHMEIYSWAANLVPRLKISEEMMMKRFILIVERKEHIKYILSEEIGSVVIGRPENIELHGHAVNAFTRLKISEDHVMERIVLSAHEETEVSELLSPWITGFGRAKALELADYAIGVLFCMEQSEDDVTEALDLRVNNETQTMKSFIENKTFYTEKILEITLHQYALNLLPILIQGNTVKRVLSMGADEEEQVRGLLGAQNTIDVGRVSEVKLVGYAIGVLPKLETSEENVMNLLSLCGLHEEHFFTILQAQDNKIAIGGRVVKCKVSSKKEVRQELEKILVDGKGNPIPIEEITNDLILD